MRHPHATVNASVVPAPIVQCSAQIIRASRTRHAMTRTHITAEQVGATQHQIAYFHVLVVMIVTVPTKHPASHSQRATKTELSCAEQVLTTPLHASILVHQEVAVNVPSVNHALLTPPVK